MVKGNGAYCQEMYIVPSKYKQKIVINRQKKIENYIQNISDSFVLSVCLGDDMKYHFADGSILILKNYKKNRNRKLYRMIASKVPEDIPTVYRNKKIILFSKSRLLALSLATSCLISLAGYMKSLKIPRVEEQIEEVDETLSSPDDLVFTEFIIEEGNSSFDMEERILASQMLFNSSRESNSPVAAGLTPFANAKIVKFMQGDKFSFFLENGEKYGVDAYLLLAKAMVESSLEHEATLPGGKNYNNHAWGIMQIEDVHIGATVSAYNYQTKRIDAVSITEQALNNIETNIQIAAMMFQNNLYKYHNNIYLTLQSYNYGNQVMDILLEQYVKTSGKTTEQVLLDYNDLGWLPFVRDIHNHPQKYLPTWSYETYGNENYIQKVLSYYIGTVSRNLDVFGDPIDIDLVTMDVVDYKQNMK